MALPITIPYTFANATSSIPLSNLDSDFTTVTNAINGIGNGTVALTALQVSGNAIASNFAFGTTTAVAGSIGSDTGFAGPRITFYGSTYVTTPGQLSLTTASAPIVFGTSNVEVMRINSSGALLVGTATVNYANSGVTVSTDAGTTKWLVGPYTGSGTTFLISAASGFGVYLASTSATSWSSLSDERTKDIIEPISDAVAKVTSLRAIIGSYKNDETKKRRAFLIAQDVQKVLPEAVDSNKPDTLGLAYTDVIPLLVASIQELSAKNDALEARLAALEAK